MLSMVLDSVDSSAVDMSMDAEAPPEAKVDSTSTERDTAKSVPEARAESYSSRLNVFR